MPATLGTVMKLMLSLVLAIGLAASLEAADFSTYHVGNSLTRDVRPDLLPEFAAQDGLTWNAGFHILGNSTLANLWNNPTSVSNGLRSPDYFTPSLTQNAWDAVVLQPFDGSTLAEDEAMVRNFINLTRSNPDNASTKFYLHGPWIWRSSDYSENFGQAVPDADNTPSQRRQGYYEALLHRLRDDSTLDAEIYLIPVGEVFRVIHDAALSGEVPGQTTNHFLYRDSLHADDTYGRLLASMTTYAALSGQDPTGLIDPADAFGDAPQWFLDLSQDAIVQVLTEQSDLTGFPIPEPGSLGVAVALAGGLMTRRRVRG